MQFVAVSDDVYNTALDAALIRMFLGLQVDPRVSELALCHMYIGAQHSVGEVSADSFAASVISKGVHTLHLGMDTFPYSGLHVAAVTPSYAPIAQY